MSIAKARLAVLAVDLLRAPLALEGERELRGQCLERAPHLAAGWLRGGDEQHPEGQGVAGRPADQGERDRGREPEHQSAADQPGGQGVGRVRLGRHRHEPRHQQHQPDRQPEQPEHQPDIYRPQ